MHHQLSIIPFLSSVLAAGFATAQPTSRPLLPEVGQTAVNFTLKDAKGGSVSLYELTNRQKVALVVLRGYPGYQCPACTKQVGELIQHAKQFQESNTHVLLIYPGTSEKLQDHAEEFTKEMSLPANFTFVTDPDYSFVNLYHLRWDAQGETAYPTTLVIDRQNMIRYVKISQTHGDRAPVNDVLGAARDAK